MELKLEMITKEYKDTIAVNQISYRMENGVYGLLGLNGAGKTTLMRMLCTLTKPTSGRITLNGEDIFTLDGSYRKELGYLPQEFGVYPNFTVYDYLMYIASIKGLRPMYAKDRVKTLLRQVGMSKLKNQKMGKLSGGMKRRVGIAQAMLNDPKILILDEPTAGLDPKERIRFRNLISELSQDRLVLLSTHIVSDISYVANEIIFMKEGEFKLTGIARQIIDSMEEQVWSLIVDKAEVPTYVKKYKVVNMKADREEVFLRIIAKKQPLDKARKEEKTLEDVFLYYFGNEVNENDDEI